METAAPVNHDNTALGDLLRRVEVLEGAIGLLNDAREIANLQGRYIYFLQAHKYDQIVEMFASEELVSVEMDNLGKFIGRNKVVDVFLKVLKPLYTMKGAMGLHMLTTPVIEVHPDRRHAWGMWHALGCNTQPDFVGKGYRDHRRSKTHRHVAAREVLYRPGQGGWSMEVEKLPLVCQLPHSV